jgi:hypothetical protein
MRLRGRQPTERRAQDVVGEESRHDAREAFVRDLARKELQEAIQFVRVPA